MAINKVREQQSDWLVMVDNDQTCPQLLDIVAEANAAQLDVVNVACAIPAPENNQAVGINVQFCASGERVGNFSRIQLGGSGVMMIRSNVWSLMPSPLFIWDDVSGEDYNFCRMATASGFKLWTHGILAGHLKTVDITGLVSGIRPQPK
jgi:hypothetical protein